MRREIEIKKLKAKIARKRKIHKETGNDFILESINELNLELLALINADMQDIFKTNGKEMPLGDEEFWNKVEEIRETNPEDAVILEELGNDWDKVNILNI